MAQDHPRAHLLYRVLPHLIDHISFFCPNLEGFTSRRQLSDFKGFDFEARRNEGEPTGRSTGIDRKAGGRGSYFLFLSAGLPKRSLDFSGKVPAANTKGFIPRITRSFPEVWNA